MPTLDSFNLYNPETGEYEELKVSTKFTELKNTVTLLVSSSFVDIGISEFNPLEDVLEVNKNTIPMDENIDYIVNGGYLRIENPSGVWLSGDFFSFRVLKNVDRSPLPSYDPSLFQDKAITKAKLAQELQDELDGVLAASIGQDNTLYATLKERLDKEYLKIIALLNENDGITPEERLKLANIEENAQVNTVTSVNTKTGDITLKAEDINTNSGQDLETSLAQKALQKDLADHTSDSAIHVTSTEKDTWNNKADKSSLPESGLQNPSITDDITKGYFVGKHMINTSTGEEWVCVDNTEGNATWKRIGYDKTVYPINIYGVKIDTANSNPETALTYTDDAIGFTPASGNNGSFNYGSWQDKFPFNQIKPCLYKYGQVNYYLNPNDYNYKADGVTPSDIISGNDGDVMIEFPKIYWKFETVGTDLYIRFSNAKVDSGYKCLAHMRGITEKDKCYISAYLGYYDGSKLRSLSGKAPTDSQNIGTFRTQAQANGNGYEQIAYFQLLMLQVLFVVMFKNRDSQTALGKGYVEGNSSKTTTGSTNTKGMFYGETTGKLQNKFCGIEDFWGNCNYFIDGLYIDTNRNILIGTENFNNTGSNYTNYGQVATANLSGFISKIQGGTETGFIAKNTDGSSTTYYADQSDLTSLGTPYFGGHWTYGYYAGAFRLWASNTTTSTAGLSSRLTAM